MPIGGRENYETFKENYFNDISCYYGFGNGIYN